MTQFERAFEIYLRNKAAGKSTAEIAEAIQSELKTTVEQTQSLFRECVAYERHTQRILEDIKAMFGSLFSDYVLYEFSDHSRREFNYGNKYQRTYSQQKQRAPASNDAWYVVLGVSASATKSEIRAAYIKLAKKAHPDAGGSDDQMKRLNAARDIGVRLATR